MMDRRKFINRDSECRHGLAPGQCATGGKGLADRLDRHKAADGGACGGAHLGHPRRRVPIFTTRLSRARIRSMLSSVGYNGYSVLPATR